jgi:eIF-2B alpha/beta/delta-like uncharacterized protein
MTVRGAPLIGATAAYGVYLAVREMIEKQLDGTFLDEAFVALRNSRPTAINLFWALDKMQKALDEADDFLMTAWNEAGKIVEEDVETCRMIGVHGLPIIEEISKRKKGAIVNILTHCNAGMLGCIEWGTITSPIYQAHEKGIKVHVWVDETRPRNQGSNLTAYELTRHGIDHTLLVDNTGGHLMQHNMVDMVIVGTDRTTRQGDVANKIGTLIDIGGVNSLLGTSAATDLLSQISNFSLNDLTIKPFSIDSALFLSRFAPSLTTISGAITNLESLANNPLSSIFSALGTNKFTLPTAGTVKRALLNQVTNKIILDPTDPNSSKIQLPNFGVTSALDRVSQLASGVPRSLSVTTVNTPTDAAISSLKTISGTITE